MSGRLCQEFQLPGIYVDPSWCVQCRRPGDVLSNGECDWSLATYVLYFSRQELSNS